MNKQTPVAGVVAETERAEKRDTLGTHAQAALDLNGGDLTAATNALANKAMTDDDFLSTYFEDVIRSACYNAVAACIRGQRRIVWQTPQPTTGQRRDQISAMAAGVVATLHDFPLPGGKRLGDATREEVTEAAEMFGKQARDMAWKSRWLQHVAQSLPSGAKVADVISAERLEELRNEVAK